MIRTCSRSSACTRTAIAALLLTACGEPAAPPIAQPADAPVSTPTTPPPAPPPIVPSPIVAATPVPGDAEPEPTDEAPPAPIAPDPARTGPLPITDTTDDAFLLHQNSEQGLVHLGADGKFTRLHPGGRRIELDLEGRLRFLWAIGASDIWQITTLTDGEQPPLRVDPRVVSPDEFTVAGGRTLLLGSANAASHDGAAWKLLPLDPGPPRVELGDIATDTNGAVWALGRTALYRQTETGFEVVPTGLTDPILLEFIAAPGGLALRHKDGLLRLIDGAWTPVDLGGAGQAPAELSTAVYRHDGALILGARDSLFVVPIDGERRKLDLRGLGVPTYQSAISLAADTSGRVWIGNDVGLVVLAADLTTLERWYPPGSDPTLAGYIRQIVVRGKGPALPAVGPTAGHVHGTFTRDGAPVAGAKVQMCVGPTRGSVENLDGPCMEAKTDYRGHATTRADGSFDLWRVPPGEYDLAVELGPDDWFVTRTKPCCLEMQPGQTLELRPIAVKKR